MERLSNANHSINKLLEEVGNVQVSSTTNDKVAMQYEMFVESTREWRDIVEHLVKMKEEYVLPRQTSDQLKSSWIHMRSIITLFQRTIITSNNSEPYSGHFCQVCAHLDFPTADCSWPYFDKGPPDVPEYLQCKRCWRPRNLSGASCKKCRKRMVKEGIIKHTTSNQRLSWQLTI